MIPTQDAKSYAFLLPYRAQDEYFHSYNVRHCYHNLHFGKTMKILNLRIENYKSFRDSGWLEFSPGFTVVIGKNNSGKSALLEAFKLGANRNYPHRTPLLPPEAPLHQQSFSDIEFSISGDELRNALLAAGGDRNIPVSATLTGSASRDEAALALFEKPNIILRLRSLFAGSLTASSYP
jgi:hypothetical protein